MVSRATTKDSDTSARLAVIEEKLETVLAELGVIRQYIPASVVKHSERIEVLARNMCTVFWIGSVLAVTLIGAFIGHILKG